MLYVKVDDKGNPLEEAKTYDQIKNEFIKKNSIIPFEHLFLKSSLGLEYKEVPHSPFPPCKDGKGFVMGIPIKTSDGTYQRTFKEVSIENVDSEKQKEFILNHRKELLKNLIDTISPLRWEDYSEDQKNIIRRYRKELLDITTVTGFPFVNLPEIPEILKN